MISGVEVTAMNRSLQFLVESLLPTAAGKCNRQAKTARKGRGSWQKKQIQALTLISLTSFSPSKSDHHIISLVKYLSFNDPCYLRKVGTLIT